MKNKKRKSVVFFTMLVLSMIGVWTLSDIIWEKLKSAKEIIEGETIVQKVKTTQEVIEYKPLPTEDTSTVHVDIITNDSSTTEDMGNRLSADLAEVDYTNRPIGSKNRVVNEYFLKKLQEYNDLNMKDMSNIILMLDSYYYGDYSEYYMSDIQHFLKDFPATLKLVTEDLNTNELENKLKDKDLIYLEDTSCCDTFEVVSMSELMDNIYYSESIIELNNITLIGVIDDRYFVFSYENELTEESPLLIVDYKTYISSKLEDSEDISYCLYKLGSKNYVNLLTDFSVVFEKNGRSIILTRGY